MPDDDANEAALVARFSRLPDAINANASLRRRGAFLTVEMLVGIGNAPVHLSVLAGEIVGLSTAPGLMRSWRFAIRGSAQAWSQFWRPIPPPGWHDLFALSKRGELTMEGDLQPFFANLQVIKDMLAAPRFMAAA